MTAGALFAPRAIGLAPRGEVVGKLRAVASQRATSDHVGATTPVAHAIALATA